MPNGTSQSHTRCPEVLGKTKYWSRQANSRWVIRKFFLALPPHPYSRIFPPYLFFPTPQTFSPFICVCPLPGKLLLSIPTWLTAILLKVASEYPAKGRLGMGLLEGQTKRPLCWAPQAWVLTGKDGCRNHTGQMIASVSSSGMDSM